MEFLLLSHPMAITGESPIWDADRECIWWIDIQAQRLLQTTMDGNTTAIPCPWQPGFVAFGQSGRLVIGLETGLWTYDAATKRWEHINDTEANRPTVRLNDGKPDRLGRLWFGSMDMTGQSLALGRLYCREIDGTIRVVRDGVIIPNAIVPLADASGLYFADSPSGVLERLTLSASGRELVRSQEVFRFTDGTHPDGACLDADDNLWVAQIHRCEVICIAPDGAILARHHAPISRATMPIIGGPDGHTLFLTSQRRFLSAQALAREPWAGGLKYKTVSASAGPVFRVAGL